MDETRQKLERSREQLSAWRERLRVKLEEADRKRTLLAKPEARRASHAPTVRLDDPSPPPPTRESAAEVSGDHHESSRPLDFPAAATAVDADPVPTTTRIPNLVPDPPTGRRAARPAAEPVLPLEHEIRREPSRHLVNDEAPSVGGRSDARDRAGARGHFATPENAATTPSGYFFSGSLVEGQQHSIPIASQVTLAPEFEVATPGVNDYSAPSLVLAAAANLLDLLLLLVLPAATLSLPVSWLAIDQGRGSLWTNFPTVLGCIFIAIFVALETAFIGSVGRTPGLRLAGLQVVDVRGRIPSFFRAFLRAIIFPLLVIPPLERIVGTSTVAE